MRPIELQLRELAPLVLSALLRRTGDFGAAEDAVQEALVAAALQWPEEGPPDNPRGWLITVASRRMADQYRSDTARQRREAEAATQLVETDLVAPPVDAEPVSGPAGDDSLTLLFLCCHPDLPASSQVPLTLRAVGGLTTREIAAAFLVPEATMAQRISRAKSRIKGTGFPPPQERAERLVAVLHVLYLIFNEGYTATEGAELQRAELAVEAIRITRQLHRTMPEHGEVAGLLALMLLTDARRPARTAADGSLVPLAEQDRSLWRADAIAEGTALLDATISHAELGPYQLQAAIAAVHSGAARAEDTDWPQIAALYRLLRHLAPGPMVALNHAVAVAMVEGPQAGLRMLADAERDERLARSHRVDAVRAHLQEQAGDPATAAASYLAAARKATSLPERRYLERKAAALQV